LLLTKDNDGYTAWHRAEERGSLEVLETLWSWAKEVELNLEEFLLAPVGSGYMAWQMAAAKCDLEVSKKLWVWENEVQPNPKALKNKLLLGLERIHSMAPSSRKRQVRGIGDIVDLG
jgi:hypothetical protein